MFVLYLLLGVFCINMIIGLIIYGKIDWDLVGSSILLGVVVAVVAALIMVIISVVACENGNYEVIATKEVELVALQDNMQVERSGRRRHYVYREELNYTYLYRVNGKGITSGSIPADSTYINFTESETPKLIINTENVSNPILKFFTFSGMTETTTYSLYIPEDSIVVMNEYQIDLK